MLERMWQVGWYYALNDWRMVQDDFGNAVVIPFCSEYGQDQDFDYN